MEVFQLKETHKKCDAKKITSQFRQMNSFAKQTDDDMVIYQSNEKDQIIWMYFREYLNRADASGFAPQHNYSVH
jgi:hypothetical protein